MDLVGWPLSGVWGPLQGRDDGERPTPAAAPEAQNRAKTASLDA